jgi:hypothetical protein
MLKLSRSDYLGIAVIGVTSILLFSALEFWSPNYFLWDDNADQYLPYYCYNWKSLVENHTIPFLNWHQYLGQTYFGQAQSAVFYIPIYIAILISKGLFGHPFHVIDILAIGHLIVSSVGVFVLLRYHEVEQRLSILASIVWISSPHFVLLSKSWIFVSYLAAFLPWNFLLLEIFLKKPDLQKGSLLAVLKGIFFYQGYVQYVLMLFLFEGIYILLQGIRRGFAYKAFTKAYAFSVLAFFILIGPLFWSLLFTQQLSADRSSRLPFEEFMQNHVSFGYFIRAQFFSFEPEVIFSGGSQLFHAGICNIFLPFLFINKKIRSIVFQTRAVPFFAIALLALLLSTSFVQFVYPVPLLNMFRWAFKYLAFFIFFLILAVACSIDALLKASNNSPFKFYGAYAMTICLQILILFQPSANSTLSPFTLKVPPKDPLEELTIDKTARFFTYRCSKALPHNLYRYLTYDFATLFEYSHFGGYDPLVSKLNSDISFGIRHVNSYDKLLDEAALNDLSQWGIQYILTEDQPLNRKILDRLSNLKLREAGSNELLVYENLTSKPLASYDGASEKPVKVQYNINELLLFPTNLEPRYMTIRCPSLPQFKCWVDEKPTFIHTTENKMMLVLIPANAHLVKIKYIDSGFRIGFGILLSAALMLGLYLLVKSGCKRDFL